MTHPAANPPSRQPFPASRSNPHSNFLLCTFLTEKIPHQISRIHSPRGLTGPAQRAKCGIQRPEPRVAPASQNRIAPACKSHSACPNPALSLVGTGPGTRPYVKSVENGALKERSAYLIDRDSIPRHASCMVVRTHCGVSGGGEERLGWQRDCTGLW